MAARMAAALAHRGPDGTGLYHDAHGGAAIAHCRLAIIDTSPAAAEPVGSEDGSVQAALNGELYNYRALACALSSRGHRLRSRSDAEVLPHLYEEEGARALERLRGMFALSVWDGRGRRLLAARDRLGEKPLYYWKGPRCLLVASEVSALSASGTVPTEVDPGAVLAYLTFGSVPAPLTMLRGVQALAPGHFLTWRDGALSTGPYWRGGPVATSAESTCGAAEAAEVLAGLLGEAVSLRRVADVPVGVFLSGGLDSAAVAALLAATGARLRTHCLALPGSPLDEAPRARAAAQALGAEHFEHAVGGSDLRAVLPELIARLDQPSVDGVNTFLLARAARSTGTVVALSGLGGDELFGGYPVVREVPRAAALGARAPARAAAAAARLLGCVRGSPFGRGARLAWALADDRTPPLVRWYLAARGLFAPPALAELLEPDFLAAARKAFDPVAFLAAMDPDEGDEAPGRDASPRSRTQRAWRRVSCWERQLYLAGQLLRDTETLAMAHALEVRAPFLDHPLVEFIDRLPPRVIAGAGKGLLRRALGERLPRRAGKGRKHGFILPMGAWLGGELKSVAEEALLGESSADRGMFRRRGLESLWRGFLAGHVHWSRPWAVVVLRLWLEARRGRNG